MSQLSSCHTAFVVFILILVLIAITSEDHDLQYYKRLLGESYIPVARPFGEVLRFLSASQIISGLSLLLLGTSYAASYLCFALHLYVLHNLSRTWEDRLEPFIAKFDDLCRSFSSVCTLLGLVLIVVSAIVR